VTKKQTKRQARAEALRRYENSCRTEADFAALAAMRDKLDSNRERRERGHEILCASHEVFGDGHANGAAIPPPLALPHWREAVRGDFIGTIFDNADEIWQVFGDWQVGRLVKGLTAKQRDALFRSAVRMCSSEEIAVCMGKTRRGVNKLLAAALGGLRRRLAAAIQERLDAGLPVTPEKRRFCERHATQNKTSGETPGE
jgi:DNA-directed RNA polymerase specialized sigma24 family protein